MTYPYTPQPGPRPGPPPGGGFRPSPAPAPADPTDVDNADVDEQQPAIPSAVEGTGHPAVDAVLRSLANAAQLAPADQIAEYEAVHRVLQETLTSIDG